MPSTPPPTDTLTGTPTGPPADVVFAGGPVHTVDAARSRATAVAVRGERIVAVGHDEVRREWTGPRTEVVDLAGRLLVPGFQDAHVHPVGAGIELGQCHLNDSTDAREYVRRVAAYAAAHPDAEWVTGGGWSMEAFPGGTPTAALLDAVVRDRPVYLPNRDHHGAWANSRALEVAGIDSRTPDPPDGRIERDADGRPTGMLQEGAANMVARLLPDATLEVKVDGLLRAQRELHSLGVTGWQDAILGELVNLTDPTDAYLAAYRDGLLTARVNGALWWDRERGAEQIPELVERREAARGTGLRATSVKIMQDGITENFTAAMLGDYLAGPDSGPDPTSHSAPNSGCACVPSGNSGLSFVDPDRLRSYVTELDALDFQVHFHALGDRAVREALDAVEAARAANGWRDTRPHLAHLQVVDPADVPRFRRLGATANIQALWAVHEPQMDELTIPFLTAERAARQYPFADLLRSGATLAAGSDWPVSSPDPLAALHVAICRRPFGSAADAPRFQHGQRLDLQTVLAAYTAGSAYVNHRDDTGVIAEGNLADLVVLDRDPFDGPEDEIGAARVAATYVGGRRVYAAES